MAEVKQTGPVEFEAKVGTDFEGTKLATPIVFKYTATQYASYDDVPAESKLSVGDMLQVVNASEKAAERAKATTKALENAGYKKPDANDPETIRANMIKMTMRLYGLTLATATKIVNASAEAAQAVKV